MAYHLRWQGRVTGPYEAAQIRQMLGSGKITRMHQLSEDRESWRQLSEYEEFQPPAPEPVPLPLPAPPEPLPRVAPKAEVSPLKIRVRPSTGDAPAWSPDSIGREAGTPNPLPPPEKPARCRLQVADMAMVEGSTERAPQGAIPPIRMPGAWRAAAAIPVGSPLCHPSFAARLAAFFLDLVLIALAIGCGVLALSLFRGTAAGMEMKHILTAIVVGTYLCWLYHALLECSALQGTLGKIALGIRVTDETGRRLTLGRASLRFFAKLLSVLLCGLGCLLAVFTPRRQALHDLLARTLVISGPAAN